MAKLTSDTVREDFDRLARLEGESSGWNHNTHYHSFLLSAVPLHCHSALDVGCGTGEFARRLSEHSAYVIGLDLSPISIELARSRSRNVQNAAFTTADMLTWDAEGRKFDFIVSIATLHHMPLEIALKKLKTLLRPGGILVILDLYRTQGLDGAIADVIGLVANFALRKRYTGHWLEKPARAEVQRAAALHREHDVYPTMVEVRQVVRIILPTAEIRRHALWRYSVVWQKPNP